MHWFFIKLENPQFIPILSPFWAKTLKQDFSQKIILFNFKPLCRCNFMQKFRKVLLYWLLIIGEKSHFELALIVFSYPQSPQANLFFMLFICPFPRYKNYQNPTQPTLWITSKPLLNSKLRKSKRIQIIKPWKYRSRQLFTAIIIFLSPPKTLKKNASFTWNPQPLRHTVQRVFFILDFGLLFPQITQNKIFPKKQFSMVLILIKLD